MRYNGLQFECTDRENLIQQARIKLIVLLISKSLEVVKNGDDAKNPEVFETMLRVGYLFYADIKRNKSELNHF